MTQISWIDIHIVRMIVKVSRPITLQSEGDRMLHCASDGEGMDPMSSRSVSEKLKLKVHMRWLLTGNDELNKAGDANFHAKNV